jgi:hypothetical protein
MLFLWRSGQLWKLIAGVAAVGSAHAIWWWADRSGEPFSAYLASLGLGFAGVVAPIAAIRCPGCGFRPAWDAVARRHHATGLQWFFALESCSACGAGDEARRDAA